MKYPTLTSASALAVVVGLTICFGQTQAEETQTTNTTNTTNQEKDKVLITFIEPDFTGDAPVGHRRGLASRSCMNTKQKIAINPLIPADSRGLTSKQSPIVWLNIAYTQQLNSQTSQEIIGELSLEEVKTNKKAVKNIPVKLPSSSGNLQLEIPYTLEPGTWYRWYLVVPFDCNTDGTNGTSNISLEGLIQRVDNWEDNNLVKQRPEDLITIYAQQGLWYDALDEAAKLKCQKPFFNEPWNNLLKQVQFDPKDLQSINQFSRCYKPESLTVQN